MSDDDLGYIDDFDDQIDLGKKAPNLGGTAYYPGIDWDSLPKNQHPFSKFAAEGCWTCSHEDCPETHYFLSNHQIQYIWNDELNTLHYKTEKRCVSCRNKMTFVPLYIEIIYVSDKFIDRMRHMSEQGSLPI